MRASLSQYAYLAYNHPHDKQPRRYSVRFTPRQLTVDSYARGKLTLASTTLSPALSIFSFTSRHYCYSFSGELQWSAGANDGRKGVRGSFQAVSSEACSDCATRMDDTERRFSRYVAQCRPPQRKWHAQNCHFPSVERCHERPLASAMLHMPSWKVWARVPRETDKTL